MGEQYLAVQSTPPRRSSRGRGTDPTSLPQAPPPPPAFVELYQKKPLPPIPAVKREPEASRLSEEINEIFNAADEADTVPDTTGQGTTGSHINWAKEEANIALILDSRVKRNISPAPSPSSFSGLMRRSKQHLRVTSDVDTADGTKVMSPPPKSSMRKILTLTGEKITNNSLSSPSGASPSGHNSPHKIKQLTGTDVDAEPSAVGDSIEVSPMSCNSSVYSQDMDVTMSEAGSLETSSSYDTGYASDPNSSYIAQRAYAERHLPGPSPPIPPPLDIAKIQKKRSNLGMHKSSLSTNDISTPRSIPNEPRQGYPPSSRCESELPDLYHMVSFQIAREKPSRPPRPLKTRQTLQLHPQTSYPELAMLNSTTSHTIETSATLPHVPNSPPATTSRDSPPTDTWQYLLYNPSLYQEPSPPPLPPKPSPNDPSAKFPRSHHPPHHRSILSKVFRRTSALPPSHTKTLSAPTNCTSAPSSSQYPLLPPAEITPSESPRPSTGSAHRYTRSASAFASASSSANNITSPPPLPVPTRSPPIPPRMTTPPRPRTAAPEQQQPRSGWDSDEDEGRLGIFRIPFAMSSMGNLGSTSGQKTTGTPKAKAEKRRDSINIKGRLQQWSAKGDGQGEEKGLLTFTVPVDGQDREAGEKEVVGTGKGSWWSGMGISMGSGEGKEKEKAKSKGWGYGHGRGKSEGQGLTNKGKGHGRGESDFRGVLMDTDEPRGGRQRAGTWSGGRGRGAVLQGDGPWL